MTDLATRYVLAVRRYLPKEHAADIAAELSDSIESEIESERLTLGRPLTAEEEAALVRAHGHPLLAASRYWPQRALIGPGLLPFWWLTLKTAVIILLSINLAIDLLVVVVRQDAVAAFGMFWGTLWGTVIFTFAIVTAVFALLERFGPDVTAQWDPRSLPEPAPNAYPRVQSAIELAFNGGFALWLSGLPLVRGLADATPLGDGLRYIAGLPFRLSWLHEYVLVLLVAAAAQAAMNALNLLRPDWIRMRALVFACTNAAVFAVAAAILVVDLHTLVIPGPGSSHVVGDIARAAQILNTTAAAILAATCIGTALVVVQNVRQLLPDRGAPLRVAGKTA